MKKVISFLLIFILFNVVEAKYIVYDTQEKAYRDYGNITNYCKALEEINKEYVKQKRYYSNIIIIQSNLIKLQKKRVEVYKEKAKITEEKYKPRWYDEIWDKTKFWAGLFISLIILKEIK